MDHFIGIQGKPGLGLCHQLGRRGGERFGILKQYVYAMGLSPKKIRAMDREKQQSLRNKLPDITDSKRIVLPRLTNRYLRIEEQEQESCKSLNFSPQDVTGRVLQRLAQTLLADENARTYIDTTIITRWDQCHDLSSVQLLEIFVSHLQHEGLDLNFFYHDFGDVFECMNGRAQQIQLSFKDYGKTTLVGVVHDVLLEVVLRQPERMKQQKTGEGDLTMLEDVCWFFHHYCEDQGDYWLGEAKNRIDSMMVINPYATTVEEVEDEGDGHVGPDIPEGERKKELTVRGIEYWL